MTNNYFTGLIDTGSLHTYRIHRRWETGGNFRYRGGIHHAGLSQLSEHIKDQDCSVFVRRIVNPYRATIVENLHFWPFCAVVLFLSFEVIRKRRTASVVLVAVKL